MLFRAEPCLLWSFLFWTTVCFYSLIEVYVTYNKMHIFKVYSLTSLDICMHPWSHHLNQDSEHLHHLQKFPGVSDNSCTSPTLLLSSGRPQISLHLSRIWFKWNHMVIYWLLQIKLLWTSAYKSECGHVPSFLSGRYLGVESLDRCMFTFRKWLYPTSSECTPPPVPWHPRRHLYGQFFTFQSF